MKPNYLAMNFSFVSRIVILVFVVGTLFNCTSNDEALRKVDIDADTKFVYVSQGVNFQMVNPEEVSEASWFFEGGEPEYYNDINPPTVYYGKIGKYSVTLNIVVGGQKHIIRKENFIEVKDNTGQQLIYTAIQAERGIITAGESTKVWVIAGGEDLQYTWYSSTGNIVGEGPKVEFVTGNCFVGTAEVSATISNKYGAMERTVKIIVERKDVP